MIEVRALRPDDDRSQFISGDLELDRFFQKYAGQNQFRLHIGTTYIAIEDDAILGYVTLSATSIAIADLPKASRRRLPKYPLPALRMARLAISRDKQGRGIGKRLLRTTLSIALDMADRTGCVAVVVDAKPHAVGFYERYGFQLMEVTAGRLGERPAPLPMFLPVGSISRS